MRYSTQHHRFDAPSQLPALEPQLPTPIAPRDWLSTAMQLATKIYLASNEELDHMYPDPTRVREIVKSLTAMERLCGELVGRSRLDENFHELWNVYTAVRDANAKIRLWQNPTH